MTFLEHMKARLNNEKAMPQWVKDKPKAYDHARKMGVHVAHVFQIAKKACDIDWDVLPNQFVVQATRGCSCNGTFPLRRSRIGYFNFFTGEDCSHRQIEDAFARHVHAYAFDVMAKEFITDESFSMQVPSDYKFFCFGGEVIGMILQVTRNPNYPQGVVCCDREWRVIARNCDLELAKPRCAEELLSQALRLAKSIETPFVRVDMFASSRGPVFGEFTLTPAIDRQFRSNPFYSLVYEQHNQEWGELMDFYER